MSLFCALMEGFIRFGLKIQNLPGNFATTSLQSLAERFRRLPGLLIAHVGMEGGKDSVKEHTDVEST